MPVEKAPASEEDRKASALRENLRRRKAQKVAREENNQESYLHAATHRETPERVSEEGEAR